MGYKKWVLTCAIGVVACGISSHSTACEMHRSPVCETNKMTGQASFLSRGSSAVMANGLSSDVPLTKEKMKRKR